jgi:hypothetical protein
MTELPSALARERQPVEAAPPLPPPPSAAAGSAATAPAEIDVQRIAFRQCVTSMHRAMMTTPLGWALAAWLCWELRSTELLPGWLALVATGWVLSLLLLTLVRRRGADPIRHALAVTAAAVIDGLCWGSLAWCLMGADLTLNVCIGAILCGVIAVNTPVYLTRLRRTAPRWGWRCCCCCCRSTCRASARGWCKAYACSWPTPPWPRSCSKPWTPWRARPQPTH